MLLSDSAGLGAGVGRWILECVHLRVIASPSEPLHFDYRIRKYGHADVLTLHIYPPSSQEL